MIPVEVVYAKPQEQRIFSVTAPQGATVLAVIEQSGVLSCYPEIDLTTQAVGVFGQVVSLETLVEPDDRVEIYRPLIMDPMEARRARAKKQGRRR